MQGSCIMVIPRLEAWASGDLRAFGELMTASGRFESIWRANDSFWSKKRNYLCKEGSENRNVEDKGKKGIAEKEKRGIGNRR
ncbi:hypothetical protein Gotur_003338 [Gossypium turneri]